MSTIVMTAQEQSAASERDAAARMLVVLKERQQKLRDDKRAATEAKASAEQWEFAAEGALIDNQAAIRACEAIIGIKVPF